MVTGTSIGQTGSITISNNGSINGTYGAGRAGVLLYGSADVSTIIAIFSRTTVVGGGLVALRVEGSGTSSPTNTTVQNNTFTCYDASDPAITLANKTSSPEKISSNPITATTNNTITGATTSGAIELLIYHKSDNSLLGLVSFTQPP